MFIILLENFKFLQAKKSRIRKFFKDLFAFILNVFGVKFFYKIEIQLCTKATVRIGKKRKIHEFAVFSQFCNFAKVKIMHDLSKIEVHTELKTIQRLVTLFLSQKIQFSAFWLHLEAK
jgi:hypothetical protein